MRRREFFTKSLAASAVAGVSARTLSALGAETKIGRGREFYEWRTYRLPKGGDVGLLHEYLQGGAIPTLNGAGVKPVGAFVQLERPGQPEKDELVDTASVSLLIPYPSLELFASATGRLLGEMQSEKAGATYLRAAKESPGFERINSWLLLAFAGMPKIEQPTYSREKRSRMFELRTYESYSELKAIKKVEMFNSGEIELMRKVELGPIFYGQALIGSALPHLSYMLSAENMEAHKKHWNAFGKSDTWNSMKADPQYADTVSKITKQFLAPAPYSQI